ncbi:MAG: hypothetical protein K5776_13630 [Lachnospiraceae bacterium]|nr:hypothetical protein [Lachnospiraceae bacterium]
MKIFLKNAWQYVILIIWFIASIVFFEYMLNRGNTDLTKEMSKASLPVVCIRRSGHDLNRMYGYTKEMDYSLIRDGITPLDEGRKLDIRIYKYDSKISSISYELRSTDKERFVEEGEITDYLEHSGYIDVSFAFKDIIADRTDYTLKTILTLSDGNKAYYYARIFKDDELSFLDKLDYVYYFNECTFNRETAQEEIGKYMESNSSGDNSNFSHVDIHSSLEQVTWGKLEVERLNDPVCTVREVDSKQALMELDYMINAKAGEDEKTYLVKEYYRFIKGKERMYLMSFDRYTNTILFPEDKIIFNDKIMLGITPEDFEHMESEDGNTYAFVSNGSLVVVNSQQNFFGTAYSFYDRKNFDERTMNMNHDIKIMDIDETGNVLFYVYGYFNRGDHEGKCGIHLFEYNSKNNVVTEKIFIELDKPYEIIKNEIGKLAYANSEDELYFYFDEKIYRVDIQNQDYEIIADGIDAEKLYVCPDMSNCAWVSNEDSKGTTELTFLSMNFRNQFRIQKKYGEHLKALGFMGEDLIYGIASDSDIFKDVYGELIVPMYEINIINKNNVILKTYSQENIFVMACKINSNLITLTRNTKNEEGALISAAPDSILNNIKEKEYKNNSEIVTTENLKSIIQITLKKEMDNNKIKYKTPKMEIYEGRREILLETDSEELYYTFAGQNCEGIYADVSDAIRKADEIYGCVLDRYGHYLWKKESRANTNQIMKITGSTPNEDISFSSKECLEIILEYEGFSLDIKNDLQNGLSYGKIIEENVPDSKGIEIENCSSEVIKYYLNRDLPVMLSSESGSVLIVGYSDSVNVWLNPQTGNLMKVSVDEAESFYNNNGNRFVTYVKWKN